jgi:hypothetical protein
VIVSHHLTVWDGYHGYYGEVMLCNCHCNPIVEGRQSPLYAQRMRLLAASLVVATVSTVIAQSSTQAGYLFTALPIRVESGGLLQCVVVNPRDSSGVWIYSPGRTGCLTRTTGPDLYRPNLALVQTAGSSINVQFEMQRILAPGENRPAFYLVHVSIRNGRFRTPFGEVPVETRENLIVPVETWRR